MGFDALQIDSVGVDLPNPGTESTSLESPALAGGFFTTAPPPEQLLNYSEEFTETRVEINTP